MASRFRPPSAGLRQHATPLPRSYRHSENSRDAILYLVEFEITEEPIYDPRMSRLPQTDRDLIEEAYYKTHEVPKDEIPILQELIEKYPDIAKLYNFLSIAYQNAGDQDKADECIERTYRLFPNYLFGMLNYAHLLLRQGKIEEVTAILKNRLSLHLWITNRRRYHISEFVSFNGLMVMYFLALGEDDNANQYLSMMLEIAPDHPGTRQIANLAGAGLIRSLARRVLQMSKRRRAVKTPRLISSARPR